MVRSSSDGGVGRGGSAPGVANRPSARAVTDRGSADPAPTISVADRASDPADRPSTPAALRWRIILDAPAGGPENMARDHALARCLGTDEAVLRLYGWAAPTVSFGRNEPAVGRYDPAHPDARDVAFVRRPTGGRAVLHDREVTYAVVVPLRAFGGPREAYAAINRGLVEGLRALGVPAAVATDGSVEALDAGPCFHGPAPGEVTAGGRKLVGSAQARVDGALLQHGSVLLDGGQELLDRIAGPAHGRQNRPDRPAAHADGRQHRPDRPAAHADGRQNSPDRPAAPAHHRPTAPDPTPAPAHRPPPAHPAPAAVSEWTAGPADPGAVAAALAAGCRLAWGGRWTEGGYTTDERIEARRLLDARYATHAWTWRR